MRLENGWIEKDVYTFHTNMEIELKFKICKQEILLNSIFMNLFIINLFIYLLKQETRCLS